MFHQRFTYSATYSWITSLDGLWFLAEHWQDYQITSAEFLSCLPPAHNSSISPSDKCHGCTGLSTWFISPSHPLPSGHGLTLMLAFPLQAWTSREAITTLCYAWKSLHVFPCVSAITSISFQPYISLQIEPHRSGFTPCVDH